MRRVWPMVASLLPSLFLGGTALGQDVPGSANNGPSAGNASGASNPSAASPAAGQGPAAGNPPGGAAPSGTGPETGPSGASGGAPPNVYAPPAGANPALSNAHLPSSSKPSTDTSRASDYFDLAPSGGGSQAVHGNPNGGYLPEGHVEGRAAVPPVHVVQRGDTLWELCDRYFSNPWQWPRIWSYNPELLNPHWIYPGEQLKMQPASPNATTSRGSTFVGLHRTVPESTVFLRDQGYIDDADSDTWGEIGGSPEDQLLLGDGDNAYLDIATGHEVKPGQELTVFRALQGALRSNDGKGTLVKILGTARVDVWDPKTRVARARLVESLDVIERGAKVGPVGRKFVIVPPSQNKTEVWGQVAASLYPHVLYGENQVVFIDRGQRDGLAPGNRLFVLAHGDEYRKTLVGASAFAASSVQYESEKPAVIETGGALGHGDDSKYPDEVVGELRVLSVREHSAACLVTDSLREIEPRQRVLARRGY